MALRWGVAAAGSISHDFTNAVSTLTKDEHQVVANGARSLSRAKEFAQRFDIPKAYGSYLELAQDPNVEVVHVGTIHTQHMDVAKVMMEHGKHVLCEVPMGMNEKQVRKLIEYAKEKNRFLVEGIWSRHFPSYRYVQQQILDGALGEIQSVDVNFGLKLTDMERLMKKETAGGGVLEFGAFCLQVCQLAFRQEPKSIIATAILNDDGVDVDTSVELIYGDNKIAKIRINMLKDDDNTAKIVGTEGQIMIPMFWCPTSITVNKTEKSWPLPKAKYDFNYPNSCGFIYEADEVRKCIRTGKIESEYVTHSDSLLIARLMDDIRKQIGVKYSADDWK